MEYSILSASTLLSKYFIRFLPNCFSFLFLSFIKLLLLRELMHCSKNSKLLKSYTYSYYTIGLCFHFSRYI